MLILNFSTTRFILKVITKQKLSTYSSNENNEQYNNKTITTLVFPNFDFDCSKCNLCAKETQQCLKWSSSLSMLSQLRSLQSLKYASVWRHLLFFPLSLYLRCSHRLCTHNPCGAPWSLKFPYGVLDLILLFCHWSSEGTEYQHQLFVVFKILFPMKTGLKTHKISCF